MHSVCQTRNEVSCDKRRMMTFFLLPFLLSFLSLCLSFFPLCSMTELLHSLHLCPFKPAYQLQEHMLGSAHPAPVGWGLLRDLRRFTWRQGLRILLLSLHVAESLQQQPRPSSFGCSHAGSKAEEPHEVWCSPFHSPRG